MSHAVEKMAYAGQTPWHGLGNRVADNLSPAEMIKAAGLDWSVSKRGVHFPDKKGKLQAIPGQYALIRDSDEAVLSMVGSKYKPVQNEQAFEFFKKFTDAGHMKMNTAGSLWGGRYVWGLAEVGKNFALGKKDEVKSFLLLMSPHVHGKAMVIQFTPIRVVCWNTLSFALGNDLKGGGNAFRMPHTQTFNEDTVKAAELSLSLAHAEVDQFKEAATLLSKTKAKAEDVQEYFCEVLKYDPKKAAKKKNEEARVPRMLPKFQHALTHAPGQALNTAAGTWWGALNAVSYVIDHESGRGDRGTALKNAWLGHLAGVKRRAFEIAAKRAK